MGVGLLHQMDPQRIQAVPQPLQLGMAHRRGLHIGGNAHLVVTRPHLLDIRLGKLQRKLTGAGAVKLVKNQSLGAVPGDELRRDAEKPLPAVPFYYFDDILHHLDDPHIDTGAIKKQVLGKEDIPDGQKGDILRHGDALMLQVIHHMHRRHHFSGNNAGNAAALQCSQYLVQVFQRQRTEQVSLDLHQVFIRKYHMVLLVKQLACLQHQPIGVGVLLGCDNQNVAVPQRDHMPQRRYHRRTVIKVDVVAARVHLRIVVQKDDGCLHCLVIAGLHQPHRVVQYDVVQPIALLISFQLLQGHLGLYQNRYHLDITGTHHTVRKLLAVVDIPTTVQGIDQVLGKAAPIVAQ